VSGPAIVARDVCKSFRVYHSPGDMVWEVVTGRPRHQDFTALDGIGFTVQRGEVVGLMGRNGAGKSTLLKIIAGTLEASAGAVEVNGRVSAILELGTGFNPEYTGRENIYLGGLCLGLKRDEIREREAEIIAFSELEDFIDRPFKTYSSGMQARLTFSVAVSVDPDILIIDEALSVGDAKFQLKSFDRIKSFRQQGKSILVVSHDMNSLAILCDRAILLDRGRVLEDGEPNRVGKIYHELLFGPPKSPQLNSSAPLLLEAAAAQPENDVIQEHRYGNGCGAIVDTYILDEECNSVTRLEVGATYRFRLVVETRIVLEDYVMGIIIRTPRGIEVVGTDSRFWPTPNFPSVLQPGRAYNFDIGFINNLAPGKFFLTAALARSSEAKLDVRFDCLAFEVFGPPTFFTNSLVSSTFSFSYSDSEQRAEDAFVSQS
jgi:lipopolysaccharide transport system ATP-binding protein